MYEYIMQMCNEYIMQTDFFSVNFSLITKNLSFYLKIWLSETL